MRSQFQPEGEKGNRFKTWARQHVKVPEIIDEYERYYRELEMEMDLNEIFDPREWWQETT